MLVCDLCSVEIRELFCSVFKIFEFFNKEIQIFINRYFLKSSVHPQIISKLRERDHPNRIKNTFKGSMTLIQKTAFEYKRKSNKNNKRNLSYKS